MTTITQPERVVPTYDEFFEGTGPSRVYVVVDRALSAGAKAAQAGHALSYLSYLHPKLIDRWIETGNVLIIVETDAEDLNDIHLTLFAMDDIPCGAFFEPDFDNNLTAIALPGSSDVQVLLKGLPLAKAQSKRAERKACRREQKMRERNR